LEEALIPGLNRLGMKTIGAFNLDLVGNSQHLRPDSSASLDNGWSRLNFTWRGLRIPQGGRAFLNAPAKEPAYLRVESSLLIAFEAIRNSRYLTLSPASTRRVYQLRTYGARAPQPIGARSRCFIARVCDLREGGFFARVLRRHPDRHRLPNLTYMVSVPDLPSWTQDGTPFAPIRLEKASASPKFSYEAIVSSITNLVLRATSIRRFEAMRALSVFRRS